MNLTHAAALRLAINVLPWEQLFHPTKWTPES